MPRLVSFRITDVADRAELDCCAGSIVDLLAAVVIVYHVLWALLGILKLQGSDVLRMRIAQGVITALTSSVAGSLLKIIGLQTWPQIRLFAFVFALRTILKHVFAWEEARIRRRVSRNALQQI